MEKFEENGKTRVMGRKEMLHHKTNLFIRNLMEHENQYKRDEILESVNGGIKIVEEEISRLNEKRNRLQKGRRVKEIMDILSGKGEGPMPNKDEKKVLKAELLTLMGLDDD